MCAKESFSIKQWATDDKPREKLMDKGRTALSDAELLAILLGSGNAQESAVGLAKRILASVNNDLNQLAVLNLEQFMRFKGVGSAKAVTIAAAMELGRRRRETEHKTQVKISSSSLAFSLLAPFLEDLAHEEFWVVYLNHANRPIRTEMVSKGGISGTLVDVRVVLRKALEYGAVGLILAHNHPSGTLSASTPDQELTDKIKLAALAMDIKVLDHLIVGQKGYFSFADEGLL
ncbi:RadC family protein [Sediminicola luteus]|uniref:MPN domain-containing protein n=1 Tax=Sediminicola luteus TaxID=319238 RepID=A0A2A4G7Z6_9FLAO|nr:DNA repair protein RadC [Sediminicola luteus]PCE64551.1 hypothetical protein B7P33_09725 [Sediminicola luteus]